MTFSKVVKGTVAAALLVATLGAPSVLAMDDTKNQSDLHEKTQDISIGKDKVIDLEPSVIGLEAQYDWSGPNFSLVQNEIAWLTRGGNAFTIEDDWGKDYNDLHVLFDLTGKHVSIDVYVINNSDYANNKSKVVADPDKYAVRKKSILTSGTGKEAHFADLDYGTYVILIKQNASSKAEFTNVKVKTTW